MSSDLARLQSETAGRLVAVKAEIRQLFVDADPAEVSWHRLGALEQARRYFGRVLAELRTR